MGRLEVALTSVCWATATRPVPAAVAPDSALAAMANPARVSIKTEGNLVVISSIKILI